MLFLDGKLNGTKLGDLFYVKVGGVSGMDKIFVGESGNAEFVCKMEDSLDGYNLPG